MSTTFRVIAVLASAILSAGCANLQSIHHRFDAYGKRQSVAIDVKQRVVLVGQTRDENWVACAEPSPDALTVIGSALAVEATTPQQIQARLAGAVAESGASIGVRTQTIQLLRDSMYRLCEGYMNGAISWDDFQQLQRRYQDSMVALLAIEQLTGATTPRQAVLTSESDADTGNLLVEAQRTLDELKADQKAKGQNLEGAKVRRDEAKKALEGAKSPTPDQKRKLEDDFNEAQKGVDDAQGAVDEAGRNVEAAERKVESARGPRTTARAGGTLTEVAAAKMDKDTATVVSKAVQDIVLAFLNKDYTSERCLRVLDTAPLDVKSDASNAAVAYCMQLLKVKTQESIQRNIQVP